MYVCVSGGKKCSFGKFGLLCFFETPVLRFALLPYYRRYSPHNQLDNEVMKNFVIFSGKNSHSYFCGNLQKNWKLSIEILKQLAKVLQIEHRIIRIDVWAEINNFHRYMRNRMGVGVEQVRQYVLLFEWSSIKEPRIADCFRSYLHLVRRIFFWLL